MTSRTIPAIVLPGPVAPGASPLAEAIRSNWAALRAAFGRAASRRRLARSIAHLDDRLLADAGLAAEQRGLSDHLIRHISAASEILTGINARRG